MEESTLVVTEVPETVEHELAVAIDVLNQLGLLLSGWDFNRAALSSLLAAKTIFDKFEGGAKGHKDTLHGTMDALHTLTNYYLAQAYGGVPNKSHVSAQYVLTTLVRQQTGEHDPIEWIKNAVGLSTYYKKTNRWKAASHCLSACELMAKKHLQISESTSKEGERERDEVLGTRAVLNTALGEFYKDILQASRNIKVHNIAYGGMVNEEPLSAFQVLGAPERTFLTPDKIVDFDSAREVFKAALGYFNKALEYHVLEGFVTAHVDLQLHVSKLYYYLSAFETDSKRALAMHLRRVQPIEHLIDELSNNAYSNSVAEVAFECGMAYKDIIELKIARMEQRRADDGDHLVKLLSYNAAGIKCIKRFLDSFKGSDGKAVTSVPPEHAPGYLDAMFCIARIHTRTSDGLFSVGNLSKKIDYLSAGYKGYVDCVSFLTVQLKETEGQEGFDASLFQDELTICKEMVQLLPMKIETLNAQLQRLKL